VQVSSEILSPARRLTRLYIIALSVVAILSIVAQLLVQHALDQQSSDARTINIAGRQRMLSQRLSKAALALQIAPDPIERRARAAELEQVLSLWERSHIGLLEGDAGKGLPGKNSPEIARVFAEIAPYHEGMVRDAKDLLAAISPDGSGQAAPAAFAKTVAQILAAEPNFLRGMDEIVFQYDREATARVDRLKAIELLLLGITLCVLLLEGLYVFRPAVAEIQRTIVDLVQTKTHLGDTVEALRSIAGVGEEQ
jgi:nitrate/nitrite-specific signal transduction histidine kinase